MIPDRTRAWLTPAAIVVVIAAVLLGVWLSRDSVDHPGTFAVDGDLPLTGFLAEYGAAVRDGATMAAAELASRHPSAPKPVFDWQDNASDSKNALTVVQRHMLSPPDVYISGIGPSMVLPVMDKLATYGIPHFVWTFDVDIRPNGQENNFRTNVSYKLEPQVFLNYAKSRGATRVAILHLLLPHAVKEIDSIVVPELKKLGISDLYVEPYELGKSSFADVAAKCERFAPNLIILNGFQGDLVNIIKAFRPRGLITDGNTIGTYDMMDAQAILGASELEGIRAVVPAYIVHHTTVSTAWTERFVQRFGRSPIYTNAFGYDAVTIMIDAAQRLTLPATPEQWCRAIAETNVPEGITGPLRFDEGGDLLVPLAVAVFRDGKLVEDPEH